MRNAVLFAILGLAVGGLGFALGQGRTPPAPARTVTRAAPSPEMLNRLDVLEARSGRLEGVERELAALREQANRPPERARNDKLMQRLTELERELADSRSRLERRAEEDPRFRHLTDEQVRVRAMVHSKEPGAEAVDAWNALLRRDLSADQRSDALSELAHVHRKLRDYPSAAALLGQALDHAGGRNTQKGQGHSHSRAWVLAYDGKHDEALTELDLLLQQPAITDAVESSARSAAASFAQMLGDSERARRELQMLVDKYQASQDAHFRGVAERAAKRLATLG